MTPPKKPEWFEITDQDNAASVRRVSKALPAIALGSALLIIGAGVVFAQSQDQAPATAVEAVVASAQPVTESAPEASAQVSAPVSASPSIRVQNVRTQSETTQTEVAPVATKAVVTPKAPGLTMPTGGGDDDDEGDHEGDHDRRGPRVHSGEHEGGQDD